MLKAASTQLKTPSDRRSKVETTKLKNKPQKVVPKSLIPSFNSAFDSPLDSKDMSDFSEFELAEEIPEFQNSPIDVQDSSESAVTFDPSSESTATFNPSSDKQETSKKSGPDDSNDVDAGMIVDAALLDRRTKMIIDDVIKILMDGGDNRYSSRSESELVRMKLRIGLVCVGGWIVLVLVLGWFCCSHGEESDYFPLT